ncbi:acyloxyacyl hydrolase [Mucilaginibacter sp. SG564]|uniref:acyloxyacyl hydrolase n=1 Tax=unclassified Mucilaginibacter TaxID=2617802 RepID=UPI001553BA29|nr:acyloxyacyl hydrolase [Mucilaginibacter sp. SG564]NOW98309.1 hypothetical protein [Mucilaginibacter sp. SG564]
MNKTLFFAIIGFLFFNISSKAQDTGNSIEISGTGGIKIFTPEKNTLNGPLFGGELAYHINMADNKRDFIRILNIKSIDAVFSYRNMSGVILNHDQSTKGVIGNTYAVLGRLEIGLLKIDRTELLLTPGFGFLYASETHVTNSQNIIIGSHINLAAQVGLKVFTPITQSTGIQVGAEVFHYSNGAAKLPNNGINAFAYTLGLVQKINQDGPSTFYEPETDDKHSFEFGINVGRRGSKYSDQGLYKTGFYAGYNYKFNPVLSMKIGTDAVYYNTAFNTTNLQDALNTFQSKATSYDRWRVGISAGPDIWLGKFAVMTGYGYYVHYHSYFPVKTYWTAGLKYYITPYLAIQAKGYIHNTEADFVGYGVQFRIR